MMFDAKIYFRCNVSMCIFLQLEFVHSYILFEYFVNELDAVTALLLIASFHFDYLCTWNIQNTWVYSYTHAKHVPVLTKINNFNHLINRLADWRSHESNRVHRLQHIEFTIDKIERWFHVSDASADL